MVSDTKCSQMVSDTIWALGKELAELPFTARREIDDARAAAALRPAELVESIEHARADDAREVVAARAPVEARAAERPARGERGVHVDAHVAAEPGARTREREPRLVLPEPPALAKPL